MAIAISTFITDELTSGTVPDGDRDSLKIYAALSIAATFVLCLPVWFGHSESIPILAQQSVAGRMLLSLAIVLIGGASHRLGRIVHGRPAWLSSLGFLAAGILLLLSGTLASAFGFALFLITLAAWLSYFRWSRPGLPLVIGLALATTCVHPPSFLALALCIAVLSAAHIWRARTVLPAHANALLPLVTGVVTFDLCSALHGGETPNAKPEHLLTLLGSGNTLLDCLVAALLISSLIWVVWRALEMRAYRPMVAAAALLILLFVVTKATLPSFLPPAAAILFLALQVTITRRHGAAALAGILLAALLRIVSLM